MEGKKERDALFDNARAVLIFLVIVGHLLSDHLSGATKLAGPRLLKEIYFAINMFHMPAFVQTQNPKLDFHRVFEVILLWKHALSGIFRIRHNSFLHFLVRCVPYGINSIP